MFNLENIGKMINDLDQIKTALKNLRIEVKKGPVALTFNGLQEVIDVNIDPEENLNLERFERWLKDCFNEGIHSSRRAAKQEIEQITGLTIPDIPGLI